MRVRNDESGQILVLTVLSLSVVMGFVAMAVDVGLLFRSKRNVQIAADAAAVAGALDYKYNASGASARTAGKYASQLNGFTDGSSGVVVTVNAPPLNGPNRGVSGFVEAIVSEPNPTVFLGLFGKKSVTVAARAVAGDGGASDNCVIITNPTDPDSMELQGSFTVSASKCGVVVDSKDPDALQFTGAGGTLSAGSIAVVGGSGGHTEDASPSPVSGAAPESDPLKLAGPTPGNGGCGATGDGFAGGESGTTDSSTTSISGNYAGPGGPSKAICFTKAVSLSNVTLGSGVYVFENGVTTSGTITSGTGGTTLDIYGGSFTVKTGTVLALVAPQNSSDGLTTYETNGIALMEPSNNSSQITIQKGDATGSLIGIIYAPSATLYLQDSGGDKSGGISLTTDLIVNKLFDKTATLTITSYSASNPTTTPLTKVTLVE